MNATAHILATVRNPALLKAASLVFKTLRVGLPNTPVKVWGNGLDWFAQRHLEAEAKLAGASFVNMAQRRTHDAWVEHLLLTEEGPIWILDTDLVFFGCLEDFPEDRTVLMGRREPTFEEEWTGCLHVERLHTCVLYADPPALRPAMRAWQGKLPPLFGATAQTNLVRQMFIPRLGANPLFYDTCAGLWQAGIGTPFTPEQNEAFEHLHCATYVDLCGPHLSVQNLAQGHQAIYAEPSRARGLQHEQARYYQARAPQNLCHTPQE